MLDTALEKLTQNTFVITLYNVLTTEHTNLDSEDRPHALFNVHWKIIILGIIRFLFLPWSDCIKDEAHLIKNAKTKIAAACFALSSRYCWCITGTPLYV